jgi:hypothetical protein
MVRAEDEGLLTGKRLAGSWPRQTVRERAGMDVAVGVAEFGVAGRAVAVGFALPQATTPVRTSSSPERVRTNRWRDMLFIPGKRFIYTIIQQVNGDFLDWNVILLPTNHSCFSHPIKGKRQAVHETYQCQYRPGT